jgi:hypothetical protein
VHYHPNLSFSVGTQVVTLVDIPGFAGLVLHPRGTVGVIVKSPTDHEHSYRVRFPDGFEAPLKRNELTMLAQFKEGEIGDSAHLAQADLYERVIYRCVIGSQAYGLAHAESDVDRRGIYLPTADQHWSLYGVPEQLENQESQEGYWELQKFLILALKANPNVLECLYTPLVEKATPLAKELLGMKTIFLSRMVYQTYNGYVMSQFKKMQADLRTTITSSKSACSLAGPVGVGLVRSHDLHVVYTLEDSWIGHRAPTQLALNLPYRLPSVIPQPAAQITSDSLQVVNAVQHQRRRHHHHPGPRQQRLYDVEYGMHSARGCQVRPHLSEEGSHPVQAQAQLLRSAQLQGRRDFPNIDVNVRLVKAVEQHQTVGSRLVQPRCQVR